MLSMDDGDLPGACDEFLAAVAVDSTFALAHLELGRLYWAGDVSVRDRERSQYHLGKARLFDTNLGSKDRLRLEAAEFDDRREMRNSLATLDEILERWPDDRQALLDKVSIAHRYWDMNEVVKTSERFLVLYPQDVHAVGGLRSNGLMAIDPEENLRFVRSRIRLHPREASSWSALGLAHLALGQSDSALVAFSRANDLDPEHGREGARADCAYQAGDLDLAIKLMGEFLARPDISVYQRLWNTTVRTIDQGLSFYLVEGGQYRRAVEESDKAHGAYFENPAALEYELSKNLIWWGDSAEGIAMLQERADEDPDWWSYFQPARLRARAAWRQGNRETLAEAAADLRNVVDRFGAMATILALQAEAELALLDERFEEALDKVAGARESGIIKPGMIWIEFHEAEARAFHGLGRLDEAIGVHEHILTLKGGHALSHFQLGRLHEEAGRREEAVRSFTAFLDMWRHADEDWPELAEARSALVRLMPD
jgi:tetratricopeptide (TPR) repeat protein